MQKFKKFISRFSAKQIILFLVAVLSLILFLVVTIWSNALTSKLSDQQAAIRWDEDGGAAQVSCFLAESVEIDEFAIMSFEKELEKLLNESMTAQETGSTVPKRPFIDAYSSQGTISIESEAGKLDANAIGIGGDFFLMHPLHLMSGQYFSGNDLMKDSIILDEDSAWQLFGSVDIAGMSVMIGGIPHYVAGVIERPQGKFAETAGLDKPIVYVSNETLTQYGQGTGINTYEVVAPNPVNKFVYHAVKEKLGVAETDMVVVENSTRYSLAGLIPIILDFGKRSMQNTAVRFPYWENIARGYEDIRALFLLLQFILLLIPIILLVIWIIIKWKHRTFTGKDVWNSILDFKDKSVQYVVMKKKKRQNILEEDDD